MYQIETGERFFKKYKELNNYKGSPRDFLKDILFPLLYGSNRHLLWVHNNSFFQQKNKFKKTKTPEEILKLSLEDYFSKLNSKNNTMVCMAGGYVSDMKTGTTSGQITEHNQFDENNVCYSYIGEALNVGVSGGLSISFFNDEILQIVFEGIKLYKIFLDEDEKIKDGQLKFWNGLYLYSVLKGCDIQETIINHISETNGRHLEGVNWLNLFFENAINNYDINTIAVSSLGQTNETYGIITVDLENINNFKEFYHRIYDNEFLAKNEKLIYEYLTHNKSLYYFVNLMKIGGKIFYQNDFNDEDIKKKKFNKEIYYKNKKISAMAELNNSQAFINAEKLSNVLKNYQKEDKGSLSINVNNVSNFLKSKTKIDALTSLNTIVTHFDDEEKKVVKDYVKFIDSVDNNKFYYFMSLVNININL